MSTPPREFGSASRRGFGCTVVAAAVAAALFSSASTPAARTTPQIVGQWRTLSSYMPINPIHLSLLHNGKVLVVAGSGNVATNSNFQAGVWDPQTETIALQPLGWDMFCNGMVALPDGRILISGGNLAYDPFLGERRSAVYDPDTNTFTDVPGMAHGRWYPTTTTLGDGRVLTFSGLLETTGTNKAVEIYDPAAGRWGPESLAEWTPPLYPRLHLMPNGTVLYTGPARGTRRFNPATRKWTSVLASTNYNGSRKYGSSVLLPLSPDDGYRARVIVMGGGNPATATTEILDTSAATLQWQYGPPMSQPRIEMNATILPDGRILALGGSAKDEDLTTASRNADLYDPVTNTVSSAGVNAVPRLYHSASLLLPDATVLFVGGNPVRGTYDTSIEIYSPAYLFDSEGGPAVRPTIDDVPGNLHYGAPFQITTPSAADIASAVLVRPGSPTHAFDMDQRLVKLAFTPGDGVLTATAPPHGNIAPPGYYMLFLLDSHGVPSIARFVHLAMPPPNQPPAASITEPVSDVSIASGESVTFQGLGADADGSVASYAWSFPGGSPASSTEAAPGAVVYADGGTYTATLTVSDDAGAMSVPVTRRVDVRDFALSAGSSPLVLDPGGAGVISTTIASLGGFTDVVDVSVSGLPPGAEGAFETSSVAPPGVSDLTITTTPDILPGIYPLTITGTSGTFTHQTTATLVIASDFAITIAPESVMVLRGAKAKYKVTVTGSGTDPIALSVSDLPRLAPGNLSPRSVPGHGTATLTVSPKRTLAVGTYVFRVTATVGGASRSVNATLVVQ